MKRKFYIPPHVYVAETCFDGRGLLSDSILPVSGGTSGGGGIIGAKAWRKGKAVDGCDDFDDENQEEGDTVKWTTKRRSLWDD